MHQHHGVRTICILPLYCIGLSSAAAAYMCIGGGVCLLCSLCCLNVCAEESKPFPWQTPARKPTPAKMNDATADLVKISSCHPSPPPFLLRILANSPILHSFCIIPAQFYYLGLLLISPNTGTFFFCKAQVISVIVRQKRPLSRVRRMRPDLACGL